MISIAIVEDEEQYIGQLREYLDAYSEENRETFDVTVFRDGDEIVTGYKSKYDIILIDIQMSFMDGMAAAEEIRKLDREVIIMFSTNMTQYAVKGYEVDALDYMVKPIEYFSFSQKLKRAISRMERRRKNYISIPVKDGVMRMDIAGIRYVESQGHDLYYRTETERIRSRGTMASAEETLKEYGFFRSNKGYLVNMKCVDGIQNNCCVIGEELLPISRNKRKEFMEALLNYMSEVMK